MKAKRVFVWVIALLVGALIGGFAAFAYSGKMVAESLLLLKTTELRKSADLAFQAYKVEDPKVGVWALTHHLKLIDELHEIGYPDRWELETHAIITHARLARLHRTLNLPKKEAQHAHETIALAQASGQPFFKDVDVTSGESLWELLERFDTREIP